MVIEHNFIIIIRLTCTFQLPDKQWFKVSSLPPGTFQFLSCTGLSIPTVGPF